MSRDQPLPRGLIYLKELSPSPRDVKVVGSHLCQVCRAMVDSERIKLKALKLERDAYLGDRFEFYQVIF